MKIVNLKTFLSLPVGTVFCKYEPCVMESLLIKGENCGERDFFYQDIATSLDVHDSGEFAEKLYESESTGSELAFDFNCESRDGCFEGGQLFAVWSPQDVRQLIDRLSSALSASEGK